VPRRRFDPLTPIYDISIGPCELLVSVAGALQGLVLQGGIASDFESIVCGLQGVGDGFGIM
jgi:hypothetical protein